MSSEYIEFLQANLKTEIIQRNMSQKTQTDSLQGEITNLNKPKKTCSTSLMFGEAQIKSFHTHWISKKLKSLMLLNAGDNVEDGNSYTATKNVNRQK